MRRGQKKKGILKQKTEAQKITSDIQTDLLVFCDGTGQNNAGDGAGGTEIDIVGRLSGGMVGLVVKSFGRIFKIRQPQSFISRKESPVLLHGVYVPGPGSPSTATHLTPGTDSVAGRMQGIITGDGRKQNAKKIVDYVINKTKKYKIYWSEVTGNKLPTLLQVKAYGDFPVIIKHQGEIWIYWENIKGEVQKQKSSSPVLYEFLFQKSKSGVFFSNSETVAKEIQEIYADLAKIMGTDIQIHSSYSGVIITGWSRGAVTAIHIANLLRERGYKGKIDLLLIDPVAGGDEGIADEMIKKIPDDVNATVLLAKGELRDKFEAQDFHRLIGNGKNIKFIPIPGTHAQIAGCVRENNDADKVSASIAGHYIKKFMRKRLGKEQADKQFPYLRELEKPKLLAYYASAQVHEEFFQHQFSAVEKVLFDEQRRNCVENAADYGPNPEIFANADHAKVFAAVFNKEYPTLYENIVNDTVTFEQLNEVDELDVYSKQVIAASIVLRPLNRQIAQIHQRIAQGNPCAEQLKAFKSALLDLRDVACKQIYRTTSSWNQTKDSPDLSEEDEDSPELSKREAYEGSRKFTQADINHLENLSLVEQSLDAANVSQVVVSNASFDDKYRKISSFENKYEGSFIKKIAIAAIKLIIAVIIFPSIIFSVYSFFKQKPSITRVAKQLVQAQKRENAKSRDSAFPSPLLHGGLFHQASNLDSKAQSPLRASLSPIMPRQ